MMKNRIIRESGISITLFLVLTALFSGSSLADYRYEKTEKMEIPVESAELLQVIGSQGDMVVTSKGDSKTISVEILKTVKAEDEERAAALAEEMGLEVTRRDDLIKLETKYPESFNKDTSILKMIFKRGPDLSMDLTIRIPESLRISLVTASGDVDISDIISDVEISTASGDIDAENIRGFLKINVASGDVDVKNTAGLVITSASGDITAADVDGDAMISVTSGDIDLKDINGDIDLKTVSSDIYAENVKGAAAVKGTSGSIDFNGIEGSVNVFTASGDISVVAVPAESGTDYNLGTSNGMVELRFKRKLESGFILKATTTTGHIDIDLPIKVSKVSRNDIVGVVREGESKVFIETSSGDISIRE